MPLLANHEMSFSTKGPLIISLVIKNPRHFRRCEERNPPDGREFWIHGNEKGLKITGLNISAQNEGVQNTAQRIS